MSVERVKVASDGTYHGAAFTFFPDPMEFLR
jgi:hypothetical protein